VLGLPGPICTGASSAIHYICHWGWSLSILPIGKSLQYITSTRLPSVCQWYYRNIYRHQWQQSIEATAANLQQWVCCYDGPMLEQRDGQTTLPFNRPCSTYYAGSTNKPESLGHLAMLCSSSYLDLKGGKES